MHRRVLLTLLLVNAAYSVSMQAVFPRRPVFLKFYKVGSESVVDFFLRASVNPRKYKSWVKKVPECDGLPMV